MQDARLLKLRVRCRSKVLKVERVELGVATGWQTENSFIKCKISMTVSLTRMIAPNDCFCLYRLTSPGANPSMTSPSPHSLLRRHIASYSFLGLFEQANAFWWLLLGRMG